MKIKVKGKIPQQDKDDIRTLLAGFKADNQHLEIEKVIPILKVATTGKDYKFKFKTGPNLTVCEVV